MFGFRKLIQNYLKSTEQYDVPEDHIYGRDSMEEQRRKGLQEACRDHVPDRNMGGMCAICGKVVA
jgi:hypothetical protein